MWKKSGIVVLALAGILTGARTSSAQVVYSPAELSQVPKVASPSQARAEIQRSAESLIQSGVKGKVQLRFVVQPNGKVDPSSVEVVAATTDALKDFAVDVIKRIEFVPGRKDGTAVASQVIMPLTIG